MKITLTEPKILKDCIAIISDLVSEAQFKITKEALELVAMDPANVAMVIFKFLSSSFAQWQVKEETTIGLNLTNLKTILKRVKQDDILTLELEEGKLNILLKGKQKRKFSVPLLDIEEKEQKVPQLTFNAIVRTSSDLLDEAIADADTVADSVAFSAEPKKFVIEASGELNNVRIEIDQDEETEIEIKGNEEKVRAKYSIEYLKKMINASKIADRVTIMFSKDYPLQLDYILKDRLQLSFILAPRVETE